MRQEILLPPASFANCAGNIPGPPHVPCPVSSGRAHAVLSSLSYWGAYSGHHHYLASDGARMNGAAEELGTGYRFSWGLVLAGAAVAWVVTFFLLTLGSGIGLLLVHPETDTQTPPAFLTGGAIYFFVVQAFGLAVGAHLTGRLMGPLRENLLQEEIRAALHGLALWAVTVLTCVVLAGLAGATTAALYGVIKPASVNAETALAVDRLFRPNSHTEAAPAGELPAAQAEATHLIESDFTAQGRLPEEDRQRLIRITAEQSGVATAEAEKRVTELEDGFVNSVRHRMLMARKLGSYVSLWIAFSLLFGALAAMVSAITARLEDGFQSKWTPFPFGGPLH